MPHRVPNLAGGSRIVTSLTVWLLAAAVSLPPFPALAQNNPQTPAPGQQAAPGPDGATVNEYAEAQRLLNGPAGNPECVWLGKNVVDLLLRRDVDTAFRHLDVYDRFGCPGGHIQAAFRCLVLHEREIDPKSADGRNALVHSCWINPALPVAAATPAPAAPAAPSAAAPSQTTTH